jgi:molybdate transport system permease protein
MLEIGKVLLRFPASFWVSLRLTVMLALLTAGIHLIIGLPLAHWLNTTRIKGVVIIEAMLTLPIVLPPTVIGFYLLMLFSPRTWVGTLWIKVTGETLAFSFRGLIVGSVIYSLPYAVRPIQSALRSVPAIYLEAAQDLGARPLRAFFDIRVPLAKKGIIAGVILSFAHTMGEFGVVLMLGGSIEGKTKVASIVLYDEVQKLNYSEAHALALVLLFIAFLMVLIIGLLEKKETNFTL